MWFIFDNIQAILITSTVMLLMLTTDIRIRQNTVEQLSIYSGKNQVLDLGEWLEEDLGRLAAHFDSTEVRFQMPTEYNGNTQSFTFHRDTLGTAPDYDRIRVETRYQLEDTETVAIRDTTIQMYQVVRSLRYKQGSTWTSWAEDGRSSPRMSYFEIQLLDNLGKAVNNESQSTFMKVNFSTIPPFIQERQVLDNMSWSTTIRLRPY